MNIISRPTQWTVMPEGEAIFNEQVTVITVEDEAAGEFLRLQQHHATDKGTIFIDPSEWPALRKALDEAFASLKK
jgi:hypothetical protein